MVLWKSSRIFLGYFCGRNSWQMFMLSMDKTLLRAVDLLPVFRSLTISHCFKPIRTRMYIRVRFPTTIDVRNGIHVCCTFIDKSVSVLAANSALIPSRSTNTPHCSRHEYCIDATHKTPSLYHTRAHLYRKISFTNLLIL